MKLTKPNTGSPPASGSWCLLPYYIVKYSINKEQELFFYGSCSLFCLAFPPNRVIIKTTVRMD